MRIQRPPELRPHVADTPTPKRAPEPTPAAKEALAWSIHLAFAAELVYEDLGDAERWLTKNGCEEVVQFDVGFTQAIGYVRDGQRCLVFRGTKGAADIVTDLMCVYYGTPPRHLGFHLGWLFVRKRVRRWLQATASVGGGLFLSGHSLGAALAVVAAFELEREDVKIQQVVTFGCPRVGSYEFWARYNESGLNAKTIRFEHGEDGVCVIPPPLLYVHVGKVEFVVVSAEPGGTPGLAYLGPPVSPQPPAGLYLIYYAVITAMSGGLVVVFHSLFSDWGRVRDWFNHPGTAAKSNAAAGKPSSFRLEKLMRWLEPGETAAGRKNPALGYLLFLPVLVALHYLVSFHATSGLLSGFILKWRWMHWFATAIEAILVQQICYAALLRLPTLLRMTTSVLLTGFLFWQFPVRQIEAVGVPALVVLIGIVLLIAYRLGGGLPDHSSAHYVKALAARGGPEFQPSPAAATSCSPEFEAHLRVLEEIARDPVQSAAFSKALEQIKKQS